MLIKTLFRIAIFFALGFVWLNALPVWACEPDGENLANSLKDPRCRLVLPANRAQQPARALAGGPVMVASAGSSLPNGGTTDPSSADYSTNLGCFLPDGSSATNALGISETCPPPFLPPRATRVPNSVPTLTASTVITKTQPKGDSPYAARTMTGEWETIGPGQQIWYRVNNENNFYLDVWMDTYGRPGVSFAVYSPAQMNNLTAATAPKGRSAAIKTDTTHDWWWKGAQAMGIWHVLVTNTSTTPMQYRIDYKQSTEERNCWSYWEAIGSNPHVYWTACR
jgi:hypothetical protein